MTLSWSSSEVCPFVRARSLKPQIHTPLPAVPPCTYRGRPPPPPVYLSRPRRAMYLSRPQMTVYLSRPPGAVEPRRPQHTVGACNRRRATDACTRKHTSAHGSTRNPTKIHDSTRPHGQQPVRIRTAKSVQAAQISASRANTRSKLRVQKRRFSPVVRIQTTSRRWSSPRSP